MQTIKGGFIWKMWHSVKTHGAIFLNICALNLVLCACEHMFRKRSTPQSLIVCFLLPTPRCGLLGNEAQRERTDGVEGRKKLEVG